MRITDNSSLHFLDNELNQECDDLEKYIANRNIEELIYENPDLLIFPPKIGSHQDEIGKNLIKKHLENLILMKES